MKVLVIASFYIIFVFITHFLFVFHTNRMGWSVEKEERLIRFGLCLVGCVILLPILWIVTYDNFIDCLNKELLDNQ